MTFEVKHKIRRILMVVSTPLRSTLPVVPLWLAFNHLVSRTGVQCLTVPCFATIYIQIKGHNADTLAERSVVFSNVPEDSFGSADSNPAGVEHDQYLLFLHTRRLVGGNVRFEKE